MLRTLFATKINARRINHRSAGVVALVGPNVCGRFERLKRGSNGCSRTFFYGNVCVRASYSAYQAQVLVGLRARMPSKSRLRVRY